jgi:tRNA wybutosine-synthesizing protein 2
MKALKVNKSYGNDVLSAIRKCGWLDTSRTVLRDENSIELPLQDTFSFQSFVETQPKELVENMELIIQENPQFKNMVKIPFDEIVHKCKTKVGLSDKQCELLSNKWELLGKVLIVRFATELSGYWQKIAEIYAEVLGAHSVLRRYDKIRGTFRQPGVELILGEKTETIHVENKVKFKFDPIEIMFSSGNIDERIRISTMAKGREIVVDMFSGIGYFSLPLAIHSRPKKIIACELNPKAHHYLCENIKLNRVNKIVEPLLGDNRKNIPKGIADRIVMGYIKTDNTHHTAAFKILKPTGGVVHYHDVGFKNDVIDSAYKKIQESLSSSGYDKKFKIDIGSHYIIKSYGPKLLHVVLDLKFKPN